MVAAIFMEEPRVATAPSPTSAPGRLNDGADSSTHDADLALPQHLIATDQLLRSLATVPPAKIPDDLCSRTMQRIASLRGRSIDGVSRADISLTSPRRPL